MLNPKQKHDTGMATLMSNPANMLKPEINSLSQRVSQLEEQMQILQHVIKSYVNPGDISRAEVEVKVKNATKNKVYSPTDSYASDNDLSDLGQQQYIKTEPQEEQQYSSEEKHNDKELGNERDLN